jgi:S1-C subfamily serine protease
MRLHTSFAACLLFATTACITPDEYTAAPDTPVQLYPASRHVRGATVDSVVQPAAVTIPDEPMDTGTVRRVAALVKSSVVSLYVMGTTPHRMRLIPIIGPGIPVNLPGQGLGSGFIVHPSGYILTNEHVIRDARAIRVLTSSNEDLPVTLVATDPVYDLALLKVDQPGRRFPALAMGDSEAAAVGDFVIAVGNPLGLGHSVTSGIVSQTHRNLSGVSEEEGRAVEFIQIDAAINPGSSGGPLVTLSGAWVGVNTAGFVQAQNIGFTVPSNQVAEFVEDVLTGNGETYP